MTLTANATVTRVEDPELVLAPLGAGVHLYRDALSGIDPAGNFKNFVPGDVFGGIAYEEKDNSAGGAAALSARVATLGDLVFALSGVTKADFGRPVFATADDTLSFTGHPDAYVGRIVGVEATDVARIRLRRPSEEAPRDGSSLDITVDFAKQGFAALDEATATSAVLGGLLKTSCVGAGLTAGTTGLMMDESTGELKMLIDNDNEAENVGVETPQVFNITKGATFELEGRLSVAGGAATDDFDFGLMGLAGGITATQRADMDAATAGLLSAKFHLDANANDVKFSSDDNAAPVAAIDTTFDNELARNHKFKIIVRPTGAVEVWIDGARYLATTAFSVGASGLLAGICNLEKSTGTGVPEARVRKMRVAGAIA